jgi:hypothetical protein
MACEGLITGLEQNNCDPSRFNLSILIERKNVLVLIQATVTITVVPLPEK